MTWVPLVQLLHVSDIHFVPFMAHRGPIGRYQVDRALKKILGVPVPRWAQRGTEGHEAMALRELRASIVLHAQSKEWQGDTTMVVTGDLSTWGDEPSVESARDYLTGTARSAGVQGPLFIYGNHDVWPGKVNHVRGLPIFASNQTLESHRDDLRTKHFPADFVELCPGPVLTLRVNTVLHHRWHNMWALGEVREDRYWTTSKLTNQISQVETVMTQEPLSILLTHHPIHDRTPWPKGPGYPHQSNPPLAHALSNGQAVARALARKPQHCTHAVRIVLSGHLHEMFPPPGQLPGCAPVGHAPLPDNSVQLTVGTATQGSVHPNGVDQTWQAVQISRNQAGTKVRIGRIVFIRSGGAGPFVPICDPNNPAACVEELILDVG